MYESEFVMLKYFNLTFCVHITSFIKSIKKTNFMTFWKFSRKIKKLSPHFIHSFSFTIYYYMMILTKFSDFRVLCRKFPPLFWRIIALAQPNSRKLKNHFESTKMVNVLFRHLGFRLRRLNALSRHRIKRRRKRQRVQFSYWSGYSNSQSF